MELLIRIILLNKEAIKIYQNNKRNYKTLKIKKQEALTIHQNKNNNKKTVLRQNGKKKKHMMVNMK